VSASPSLAAPSDPGWAARAVAHLDEVLVDHAHCEKKAASTAVSLLFTYAEHTALLAPLARLAREELVHFERVLAALGARGVPFGHQLPSPYANRLRSAIRPDEPARLLDTLLCLSLIEARSCERMRLLAAALEPDPLADLYHGLVEAESRHHDVYVELASGVAREAAVRARLAELARHEAAVLAATPPLARFHG